MQLRPGDVDVDAVRANRRVLGGRFGDGGGAGGADDLRVARGASSRLHTVLDLDYRPVLWTDANEGDRSSADAIDHATVAIGNRAEARSPSARGDPDEAARRLLARGLDVAVARR